MRPAELGAEPRLFLVTPALIALVARQHRNDTVISIAGLETREPTVEMVNRGQIGHLPRDDNAGRLQDSQLVTPMTVGILGVKLLAPFAGSGH